MNSIREHKLGVFEGGIPSIMNVLELVGQGRWEVYYTHK